MAVAEPWPWPWPRRDRGRGQAWSVVVVVAKPCPWPWQSRGRGRGRGVAAAKAVAVVAAVGGRGQGCGRSRGRDSWGLIVKSCGPRGLLRNLGIEQRPWRPSHSHAHGLVAAQPRLWIRPRHGRGLAWPHALATDWAWHGQRLAIAHIGQRNGHGDGHGVAVTWPAMCTTSLQAWPTYWPWPFPWPLD